MPLAMVTQKKIIMSHNVRSFPKHEADIAADHDLKSVSILHLTESRLPDGQTLTSIGNLQEAFRIPCVMDSQGRPIHGSLVLVSPLSHPRLIHRIHNEDMEIIALALDADNVAFVGVYFTPTISVSSMIAAIQATLDSIDSRMTTILMGDFNIDTMKDRKRSMQLCTFMQSHRLFQIMTGPTHDSKRCIDLIWVRQGNASVYPQHEVMCGTTESYFSDHKPIWAGFDNFCNLS